MKAFIGLYEANIKKHINQLMIWMKGKDSKELCQNSFYFQFIISILLEEFKIFKIEII